MKNFLLRRSLTNDAEDVVAKSLSTGVATVKNTIVGLQDQNFKIAQHSMTGWLLGAKVEFK